MGIFRRVVRFFTRAVSFPDVEPVRDRELEEAEAAYAEQLRQLRAETEGRSIPPSEVRNLQDLRNKAQEARNLFRISSTDVKREEEKKP